MLLAGGRLHSFSLPCRSGQRKKRKLEVPFLFPSLFLPFQLSFLFILLGHSNHGALAYPLFSLMICINKLKLLEEMGVFEGSAGRGFFLYLFSPLFPY
jgi:hypothetical protein